MSQDAMDHLGGRRMGREQRAAYARVKRLQEEGSFLGNNDKVKETSSKFNAEVERGLKLAKEIYGKLHSSSCV